MKKINMVHGDLSVGNVMLSRETASLQVKIIDFETAALVGITLKEPGLYTEGVCACMCVSVNPLFSLPFVAVICIGILCCVCVRPDYAAPELRYAPTGRKLYYTTAMDMYSVGALLVYQTPLSTSRSDVLRCASSPSRPLNQLLLLTSFVFGLLLHLGRCGRCSPP